MNRRIRTLIAALLVGWLPMGEATLSEPDHILYGTVRSFGNPVADGTIVSLVLGGQTETLVSYAMGSDPQLNGLYALRVPMDSVDPRVEGTARPGEAATVFIGETLAAEISIGAPGTARRLDLDPANLTGFPNLSIADVQTAEGSSGSVVGIDVPVSISTTSADAVTFDWVTMDGTATAGACASGGDYDAASGSGTIPPGELSTAIQVMICGDTEIEDNENFSILINNLDQANPLDLDAVITILDDDAVPTATVNDVVVLEPTSGTAVAQFTVSLDRVSTETISIDYQTGDGTALAGTDYESASGTVVIPPGNPTANIAVTVLADGQVEENETFSIQFSNPVGVGLATSSATAVIVDPAFDPTVEPIDSLVDGGENDGLSGAGALLVTRDDTTVLVAGRSEDKLAELTRNATDGSISFDEVYDATRNGFTDALFDGMADLVQSADGRWIFLVSSADDAVSIFERTGSGIEHRANSALSIAAMDGAVAAALSPDARHLYVAARAAASVNVFAFDAGGPSLSLIETESDGVADSNDGGGTVNGLAGATSVAVSPDGRSVYVAGNFDNAVAFFERNDDSSSPDFGRLTFRTDYVDNIAGVTGIGAPVQLVVAPEGGSVYVIGGANDSLASFQRDRATGVLTFRRAFQSGVNSLFGMEGPAALRMSRDGRLLLAAGFDDDTLVLFDRDATVESDTYGELTLADIRRNGEGGLTDMVGPSDIDFSQDDRFIYVSSSTGNSVVVLRRFPRGDTVFGGGFE